MTEEVPEEVIEQIDTWIDNTVELLTAQMIKLTGKALQEVSENIIKAPTKAMEIIGKIQSGISLVESAVNTGKQITNTVKGKTGALEGISSIASSGSNLLAGTINLTGK